MTLARAAKCIEARMTIASNCKAIIERELLCFGE